MQSGEADIGIATEALNEIEHLVTFHDCGWHHAVVVPEGHALAVRRREPLPVEELAEHPLIAYHEGYTGRARIVSTFAKAGLTPGIVMSALDADVIKTDVEVGLGIVASMAFEAQRDQGLVLLPAQHIFEPNTTLIAVHRGNFLRGYAYRFLQECVPTLTEAYVQ